MSREQKMILAQTKTTVTSSLGVRGCEAGLAFLLECYRFSWQVQKVLNIQRLLILLSIRI